MTVRTHTGARVDAALLDGANRLADLVAVSFGPHGTPVVMTSPRDSRRPELVTRGGVIARRLIEIEDPLVNMGMLIARQVACTVDEAVGDGATTAVLIYRRLLGLLSRLRAAGADTRLLGDELRDAASAAETALTQVALPLSPEDATRAVIATAGVEADLGAAIEHAVLAVGPGGTIEVAAARGRRAEVEVIEGFHSRATTTTCPRTTTGVFSFGPARVLVSADPWSDVGSLARVAAAAKAEGWATLLLVAPSMSEAVRGAIDRVDDAGLTVVAAEIGSDASGSIRDLAAALEITPVATEVGDDPAALPFGRLGTVRRGWASRGRLAVVPQTRTDTATRRAVELRAAAETTTDLAAARALRRRAGILEGASALLRVPSATEAEAEDNLSRVESLVGAAQLTAAEGVVAGAGATLARLDLAPATLGAEVLRDALAEPARVLAARAGIEPETHVRALRSSTSDAEPEHVEPVAILRCAVRTATSAAAGSLAAAVLVRKDKPEMSVRP